MGKNFQFMMLTFLENASNLCIFAHVPVPQSKLQGGFFENLLVVVEAIICSIKIRSENMKMTWNISLFTFGMIAMLLNVMALQFCL